MNLIMKKYVLLIVTILNTNFLYSQIDEIKKTNGENILCKVDSINSTHIFYHFQNETESKYISKISTGYIRYSSGRIYMIENRVKYPFEERESYLKECFNTSKKISSDSTSPIKILNYCINSLNTIESKLSYKDLYKFSLNYKNNVNYELTQDFMLDVNIIHMNDLINSPSYETYEKFINVSSQKVCECIIINNQYNDITKNSIDCMKKDFLDRFVSDKKYTSKIFYNIFKDTSSSFVGKIFGETIPLDIEKNLYNNCEFYINEKIKERKLLLDKYTKYNKDSLKRELNILLKKNNSFDDRYYLNRGLTYFYLGEFEKSISDYNRSYEMNPKKISILSPSNVFNKSSKAVIKSFFL